MKKINFDFDDFLASPIVLWFIAIGLSVLMWFHVTAADEKEYITRTFSCNLEYRNLDPQILLRSKLSEIEIEIKGPEDKMARLDYDMIKAYVDAKNLTAGNRYTEDISVELPDGIILVSSFPSQVVLDLIRQVTRLMQVGILLPNDIPEGQYVEGVEIIPKEVGIKGAEDDLAKIGSVRITPSIKELQSGQESFMAVKFVQSEPFTGDVTVEPAQVRFKGTLVRGLPRKRVPVNVKLTGELDGDYEITSVTTDPSEIQIEGEAEQLAKIEAIDTETVDISLLSSNQVIVVPLKYSDMDGITPLNTKSVRLTLQLSEVHAEKRLSNIPVELKNSDASVKWRVNPEHVSVVIEGRPSLIEKLTPENSELKAFADMSNIFMTPVILPVRTEINSSDVFKVVRVEPQNVTVENFK